MRGDILFLAHRLPFPPDRGDRIRSHHVLKALAQIAPVHVGCFVDTREELAHIGELARIAASYCVIQRGKPLALAGIEALARGEPVSISAYRSAQLGEWVCRTIAEREVSAIWVFSGQMGQFVPDAWHGRLLVDLCDVDSAKFDAYGSQGTLPRRWLHAREGRLLGRYESGLAARADHTLLVSEAEAQLLRGRIGNGQVGVLRNGIDAEFFSPGAVEPQAAIAGGGPQYVFTGQMDYPPNVAAVTRFARAILPRIRDRLPEAHFHIVGRAPTADVQALEQWAGCQVHGEVPDVRPYLAAADIVIAPLTIARGVQNKVLEAMAMARPVLLSPEAATGIDAADGIHWRIAANDAQFAEHAHALASDMDAANAMGHAAREFVVTRLSWPAMLAELPNLLARDEPARDVRDAA